MTKQEPSLKFLPSGDTGLTVVLGDVIDRNTSARVMALRAEVDAAGLKGVLETVPTYLSLLVHYDPLRTSQADLIEAISTLSQSEGPAPSGAVRAWSLPVCFEGEDFAPDLSSVAEWAGLSSKDVVGDIASADQFVYMLGFAPGQPYLGDLPERLAIPRRMEPVPSVPAGSVLTATGKTVIYSTANPTGWYVVGRTPVCLFDLAASDPGLLRAGDRVKLRAIGMDEYRDIASRIAKGAYDPRQEALE